jgi:hypothetical protein
MLAVETADPYEPYEPYDPDYDNKPYEPYEPYDPGIDYDYGSQGRSSRGRGSHGRGSHHPRLTRRLTAHARDASASVRDASSSKPSPVAATARKMLRGR